MGTVINTLSKLQQDKKKNIMPLVNTTVQKTGKSSFLRDAARNQTKNQQPWPSLGIKKVGSMTQNIYNATTLNRSVNNNPIQTNQLSTKLTQNSDSKIINNTKYMSYGTNNDKNNDNKSLQFPRLMLEEPWKDQKSGFNLNIEKESSNSESEKIGKESTNESTKKGKSDLLSSLGQIGKGIIGPAAGSLLENAKSFIDKLKDKKSKEEVRDWIPEVMQLTGDSDQEKYLNSIITSLNESIDQSSRSEAEKELLKWDQNKVDKVWEQCNEFYEENGVEVDPRLLLSIVRKEGTGSFNTDAANLAADGQNGANLDFDDDLTKAVDFLGGKITAYPYFQEDFSKARETAYQNGTKGISDYDDILHYMNWETPRLQLNSKNFSSGVYAGNNTWHRGVREFYSNLSHDTAAKDYTDYASSLGKQKTLDVASQHGITIKNTTFSPKQNGQDSGGNNNGEYTITGAVK